MTPTPAEPASQQQIEHLLDALTPLLVRGFREALYSRLRPACPVPVTDGTYPLLTALADGPATAAQIAARVGVDRTVITKQATALQQAGLIQRQPHPTDARATLLDLTPDGRATTRNQRQASLEILQSLLGPDFDPDSIDHATHVLTRMYNNTRHDD